jgi:transposase
MTYSVDFRAKALQIKKEEKLTYEGTGERFGVSRASLVRWNKKLEPQTTRDKPATRIDMDALKQDIEDMPDAYQYERAERLNVSRRCVQHALKRLGVTYKKNPQPSQGGSRKTICLLPGNRSA